MFDDSIKEEVRERTDILELISSYGIELKQRGKINSALCPFHQEKTSSFKVFTDPPQRYHCFGCSAGGDVFKFVMEMNGMDFPEALKHLAEKAGVHIERSYSQHKKANPLYEMYESACQIYESAFQGSPAEHYISSRGIRKETAFQFRLGYAPDSWDFLLNKLSGKFRADELEKAGLTRKINEEKARSGRSHYDYFRNRAIFPIFDTPGRVIAFAGRTLSDDPAKYLNSPESEIYKKGRVLYGMNFALKSIRESKRAVVVEGYTDVISAHQDEMSNFVATGGTAFTEEYSKDIARRFPDCETILCFDGDDGGIRGAIRSVEISLPVLPNNRVCTLPDGEDPASLLQNGRRSDLETRLSSSIDSFDFFLSKKAEGEDLSSLHGRLKIIEEMKGMMKSVDEEKREIYIETLSQKTGISKDAIHLAYGISTSTKTEPIFWEDALLMQMLSNPSREIIRYVSDRLKPEDFKNPFARKVYDMILNLPPDLLHPLFCKDSLFKQAYVSKSSEESPEVLDMYLEYLLSKLSKPFKQTQKSLEGAILEVKMHSISSEMRRGFSSGKSLDDMLSLMKRIEEDMEG